MLRKSLLVSMVAAAISAPALAQNCDESKPATASMSRFSDAGKGVLKDKESKKSWLRCPLGMSWTGSGCEGTSLTYTWSGAKGAIDELNAKQFGGHKNWRLPSKDELQSIVEQRCFKPAIDLAVFPFSPESGFWTATENKGVNPRAWVVHFLNGQAYIANQSQRWRVRPIADK